MNILEFNNISKQYRLGLISTGTISKDLNRWWSMHILGKGDPYLKIGETNDRAKKGVSDYVWALRNINFTVKPGEVVGIIGKNGAGKSTLLKLLSRVTTPSTGSITARGRIASLLEVGTGFHPEMTGRENIYLNGAIMGMTKAEITQKMDEIIDFSGCARYIDTPVKRYSSGMTVRLGFAIAAHLEPEILVVDEVLAVGDAEFQRKALGKMHNIATEAGRTVLFVSHNMNAVKNLCQRGIVLNNGTMAFDGEVNSAIEYYLHQNIDDDDCSRETICSKIKMTASYVTIHSILINGIDNNRITINHNQRQLEIVVRGHTTEPIETDLSVVFRNSDEVPVAALQIGHMEGTSEYVPEGDFTLKRVIHLPRYLFQGKCTLDIMMHQPNLVIHMDAPQCAHLAIEGNTGKYGRALEISKNGLIGLELLTDEFE